MRIFVVDSQKLTAFESCEELYRLSYIENWRPVEQKDYIDAGSIMHAMLAFYYSGKKAGATKKAEDHRILVADCEEIGRREYSIKTSGLTLSTIEEEIKQFREYVLHYQYDGWEPLYIEQPFSKILYQDEEVKIIIDGIIDLIASTPYGTAVVDHKTYTRKYAISPMNNQFALYSWAFGINNVVINRIGFQQTLKTEERFNRPWIRYQRANIKEWERDALVWCKRMISAHLAMKEGYDPDVAWLHNLSSCDKFNGCFFRPVCSLSPDQRKFTLQAHFYKSEPWSPYTRDEHQTGITEVMTDA